MRQYELTYLVSDKVPDADLNKVTAEVTGHIAENGGKLLKEEVWKRRKLAYPIKKQDYATYVSINFELPREKANTFERQIRLAREIIRHLMIVQDMGSEALTLTADEIAGTEDIEGVIGEKSFEAVEGETEESKDLMAVRETEEPEETEEPKNEATKEEKEEAEDSEEDEKAEETEEEPLESEEEIQEPAEETEKTQDEKTEKPEKEEKPKKSRAKKSDKPENEADRLAKLDEELDNILKDEL